MVYVLIRGVFWFGWGGLEVVWFGWGGEFFIWIRVGWRLFLLCCGVLGLVLYEFVFGCGIRLFVWIFGLGCLFGFGGLGVDWA